MKKQLKYMLCKQSVMGVSTPKPPAGAPRGRAITQILRDLGIDTPIVIKPSLVASCSRGIMATGKQST